MAAAADGRLFVPLQRSDRIVRLAADGKVELEIELPNGSYPFECLVHDERIYVSLWAKSAVAVFEANTGQQLSIIATGEHPSELCLDVAHNRMFVSNANDNSVSSIDLASQRVTETLLSALFPTAPPG